MPAMGAAGKGSRSPRIRIRRDEKMTEQELYERLIDTQQRLIVELQIQNRELRERLRSRGENQMVRTDT